MRTCNVCGKPITNGSHHNTSKRARCVICRIAASLRDHSPASRVTRTPTVAREQMACERCNRPIEAGERIQRGAHWACYIDAYRAGRHTGLPRAKGGRKKKEEAA